MSVDRAADRGIATGRTTLSAGESTAGARRGCPFRRQEAPGPLPPLCSAEAPRGRGPRTVDGFHAVHATLRGPVRGWGDPSPTLPAGPARASTGRLPLTTSFRSSAADDRSGAGRRSLREDRGHRRATPPSGPSPSRRPRDPAPRRAGTCRSALGYGPGPREVRAPTRSVGSIGARRPSPAPERRGPRSDEPREGNPVDRPGPRPPGR